jgi:hypothetical protein
MLLLEPVGEVEEEAEEFVEVLAVAAWAAAEGLLADTIIKGSP